MSWIGPMVARSLGRRVETGLDGVYVRGLGSAREARARGPVVFAATHVAFWDGPVVHHLDQQLGGGGRVWVRSETLERLPFLAEVGAVPVHIGEPARLRRDLRDAARFLDRPGRAFWVFPQGEHRPPWLRPLQISRGAEALARAASAALLPVALTYVFRDAPAPACFVDIGDAVVPGASLEAALVEGLARIDRALDPVDPSFVTSVATRQTGPGADLASRALAWGMRHA